MMKTEIDTAVPKISIITPSYNQAEFLEDCIKSVTTQGYSNLEYIVIDGGSHDNSVEIIKCYEDVLDYWVSEADDGQSNAINKGFKFATGDIVAWLNSDDFYLPNALHNVAKAYKTNPAASFYYGNGYRADINGVQKNKFFQKGTVVFNLESFILGLNYILQPAAFINRNYLKQINYLNENLHYGMDSDLWIRLAKQSAPQAILSCLAASREYGETKTSKGTFLRFEELRQIAEKHSEYPITPGTLLYFLDTLHRFVGEENGPFPVSFQRDIEKFWQKAAQILKPLGLGPDGIPLKTIK
jgi:glycosyltransferase involved in cell wall biosynthesis